MNIAILDDIHHVFGRLPCYKKLAGHEVTLWHDHTKDLDILAERLKDTEVLALHRERTPIPAKLIERLPKLRLISLRGPYPHIDVAACTKQAVVVCSKQMGPEGDDPAWATAELTLSLILLSLRELPQQIHSMKTGRWQSSVGRAAHGRVLGIYSYGRIGAMVADYARALGMRVQVWGRGESLIRARDNGFEVAQSREHFFSSSDVISVHLRITQATQGLITEHDLLAMQPTSVFVNTSRAGLVAPGALINALRAGRPGYAAVDVYDEEPLTDVQHPLLTMPNVICTPHMGGVELDALDVQFSYVFSQIAEFAEGRPQNVINPDVLRDRSTRVQ